MVQLASRVIVYGVYLGFREISKIVKIMATFGIPCIAYFGPC